MSGAHGRPRRGSEGGEGSGARGGEGSGVRNPCELRLRGFPFSRICGCGLHLLTPSPGVCGLQGLYPFTRSLRAAGLHLFTLCGLRGFTSSGFAGCPSRVPPFTPFTPLRADPSSPSPPFSPLTLSPPSLLLRAPDLHPLHSPFRLLPFTPFTPSPGPPFTPFALHPLSHPP